MFGAENVGRSDAEAILVPQLVNQPTLAKEQPSSQRKAEAAVPGRGRTGKGVKGPVVFGRLRRQSDRILRFARFLDVLGTTSQTRRSIQYCQSEEG